MMYEIEFWLWTILPVINTIAFVVSLLLLVLRKVPPSRRLRIILAYTGASLLAVFIIITLSWLDLARAGPGYMLNPAGPFAAYTQGMLWVAGIGLGILGLVKLIELLKGGTKRVEQADQG